VSSFRALLVAVAAMAVALAAFGPPSTEDVAPSAGAASIEEPEAAGSDDDEEAAGVRGEHLGGASSSDGGDEVPEVTHAPAPEPAEAFELSRMRCCRTPNGSLRTWSRPC